jgi:hypothetical protein
MRLCYAGAGMLALAVTAFALSAPLRAEEKGSKEAHHAHHSPEMEKCLKACAACARECESCFDHCAMLTAQGRKEHLTTLRTCVDCGDLCAVSAKIISRNGALMVASCDGCAKACDACGDECEKYPDDAHMKACAKACRECARACRDMIKSAGHAEHRGGGDASK